MGRSYCKIEQDSAEMVIDRFHYNAQKYWVNYDTVIQHIANNSLTMDIANVYYMDWLCVIAQYSHAAHLDVSGKKEQRMKHATLMAGVEAEMKRFRIAANAIKTIIDAEIKRSRYKKYINTIKGE